MTKKQGQSNCDDFEGDCIYLAREVLESQNLNQINFKADIYSLGLSLMEIIFKIELPQSGNLWSKLRNGEFELTEDFLKNSNFTVPNEMQILIKAMIHPNPDDRPSTNDLLLGIPQLTLRTMNLRNGCYQRSFNPSI